ncbi:MAG: polysaccharide deacetylase family protein [Kiritimatiellia bacterium]
MRTLLKASFARAVAATGGLRRRHAGRLVVLTFHRVRPDGEADAARPLRALETPVADFRRLLVWMRARYEPLALADWLAREAPPARAAFAVTFDDGWADNAEHAFPILRELGIPATIFLATGAVEERTPFWWQRAGLADAEIERLKRLPPDERAARLAAYPAADAAADFLTWDQVRAMGRGGLVRFGAHGHRHELLDQVPRAEALADVRRCWDLLQARAPEALVPALAWPNGNARGDLVAELEALGLRAAFGTARGAAAAPGAARWNLPRNDVDRNVAQHPGLWNWLLWRAK